MFIVEESGVKASGKNDSGCRNAGIYYYYSYGTGMWAHPPICSHT